VRSGSGKDLVARAIKNVIRWALTSRDGDDAGDFPAVQVGYLGKVGDAVAWYPYGLHANVPAGELAVILSMQGNPEARVALPGSPKSRPHPIAAGEVVLYHPATGSRIHLKANGDVVIDAVGDLLATVAGDASVVVAGNIDVDAVGNVSVSAGGNASVDAAGNAAVSAGVLASIDAPQIQAALGATLKLLNEVAMAKYNAHIHTVPGNPNTSVPTVSMVADVDTTTKLRGS
jgi:phage gp45-like